MSNQRWRQTNDPDSSNSNDRLEESKAIQHGSGVSNRNRPRGFLLGPPRTAQSTTQTSEQKITWQSKQPSNPSSTPQHPQPNAQSLYQSAPISVSFRACLGSTSPLRRARSTSSSPSNRSRLATTLTRQPLR